MPAGRPSPPDPAGQIRGRSAVPAGASTLVHDEHPHTGAKGILVGSMVARSRIQLLGLRVGRAGSFNP